MIACALCGKPIPLEELETSLVAPEVLGYGKPRGGAGGQNHVALRRPTGRYAHVVCIEMESRRGGSVSARQERLV